MSAAAAWRIQARGASSALLLAWAAHAGLATAAPADCAALRSAYRSALPAAQACDAKVPKSCAAQRVAALEDACRCQVSVNPERTQQLDRLLAEYRAQGCPAEPALCNRMCTAPGRVCGGAPGTQPACGQH